MSNLFEQVAEPQFQSTNKPRKPKPVDPTLSPLCVCGKPKYKRSLRCARCRIADGKSLFDPNTYFINGEPCRKVPLTQGQYALVFDSDFDRLMAFEFFAKRQRKTGAFYATRTNAARKLFGMRGQYMMSAMILGLPFGTLVDHQNGDTLDNRRTNLRPADDSQNAMNRKTRRDSASGMKGVQQISAHSWRTTIFVDGKIKPIAICTSLELAAKVRDLFSLRYFGEFARLNYPEMINEYRQILSDSEHIEVSADLWSIITAVTHPKR